MPIKVCSKCKREFPATEDFFARLTRNKDGLRSECKECKSIIDKEWKRNHPKPKKPRIKTVYSKGCTKTCKKCGTEYPATTKYFEPWKGGKYGIYSVCRTCRKGYNKEPCAKYYKNNRDLIAVKNKRYYEANIEKIKAHQNKNKEKIREKRKRYFRSDQGKQIKKRLKAKRKSAINNLPIFYTLTEWNECLQHFDHCCCYCGQSKKLEQDHFIAVLKGGEYTKNNIVPACKSCNSSKCDGDFFEWYPKQKFYSKRREKKILKYLNYKNGVQQLSIYLIS